MTQDHNAEHEITARADYTWGACIAEFALQRTIVRIYTPQDLAAEESALITVELDTRPDEGSPQSHQADRLEHYTLQIGDEEFAVRAATHEIHPRSSAGMEALPVLLKSRGRSVSVTHVPCMRSAPRRGRGVKPVLFPGVVVAGRPFPIIGPFSGDSTSTFVGMPGIEGTILAKSGRTVVARFTNPPLGEQDIVVRHKAQTTVGRVRVIDIAISQGADPVKEGDSGELTVAVTGLEGLREPIPLCLINATPGTTRLTAGVVQRLSLLPKQVSEGAAVISRRFVRIGEGTPVFSCMLYWTILANVFTWHLTCNGCNEECQKNETNCTGDKLGPEEDSFGPIKASNADIWKRVRQRWQACVTHECTAWISVKCCSYKAYVDKGYKFTWKKAAAATPDTFVSEGPSTPCGCGGLIDMAIELGLAATIDKKSRFDALAAQMCPGLSWDAAATMATSCGLSGIWDEATQTHAKDWSEWLQKLLASFGGGPSSTTPAPSQPVPTGGAK